MGTKDAFWPRYVCLVKFNPFSDALQRFSLNMSTGKQCDIWSWHPDSRPSAPSPPQQCPGSDDLKPVWSAPGSSAALPAPSAPAAKCMCSAPGCKSTHIRRDCNRLHCKLHPPCHPSSGLMSLLSVRL